MIKVDTRLLNVEWKYPTWSDWGAIVIWQLPREKTIVGIDSMTDQLLNQTQKFSSNTHIIWAHSIFTNNFVLG